MVLSGNGFLNGPLPRHAMVKSTEGLTHAREYFPSATAMISRKLPVVNDRETSFLGSPALLRSDKRRRRPSRVSVCRTLSAARLVWCDNEVSYNVAAISSSPLARCIPALYRLMAMICSSGMKNGYRLAAIVLINNRTILKDANGKWKNCQ